MGKLSNISPYKGDGTTPLLQKWLDILWDALRGNITTDGLVNGVNISKLATVVDLTSATSDYSLSVGETAKINITAASTPLNIAVEDGVYEIEIQFDRSTVSADRALSLSPNNTTYAGVFERYIIFGTGGAAGAAGFAENSFVFSVAARPHIINAKLTVAGNNRTLEFYLGGTTGGVRLVVQGDSYWRSATVYTSLGTLEIGEAATAVCYFHRRA